MKIVIACDHSGIKFKENIITFLKKRYPDIKVIDAGVHSEESVDYPDIVTEAVKQYRAQSQSNKPNSNKLILLCGTGIGVSVGANKHDDIICALVRDVFSATMATEHNHANAIALGVRVQYHEPVEDIIAAFLEAKPEGGRHQRRVNKLYAISKHNRN